ncbi:alpha/beta fold hydrolase [Ornithobacterium rhinotracheale]|uniref:alpha/beta fold hydrolase n=1 Tax=Ornithobacterium rhinotracheale TaxID=28251 RepID=UPI0038732425
MDMNYKIIGEGKPVVLLHGFLENHKMWIPIAEAIPGYKFIIPDLLGHGETRSEDEVNTMEDQARNLVKLLKELEVSSATFIGHSMGGYIAMVIARDYSSYVEKLGLFFSKTTPDSEEKKAQRLQAVRVAEENKERFVELGVKGLFAQDNLNNLRPQIAEAQSWGMETPIDGLVSALRGMREREDTTYLLEKLNYPILIVLGEKDPSTEKEFKDLIPKRENIQVHILPCGHMGMLELPEASTKIIQDFLSL